MGRKSENSKDFSINFNNYKNSEQTVITSKENTFDTKKIKVIFLHKSLNKNDLVKNVININPLQRHSPFYKFGAFKIKLLSHK